jgi:hypothetical protein
LIKTISIFAIILLLITAGCSKQSAPDISSPETRGQQEQERLDACTNVNFSKGVLLYHNVQLLFKCTKWSQEFPHLFESINKTSEASWNQVFAPINEAFLENLTRRDRFFKNIRDLDSKGGLDGLSYVIVALNETNFFDSTKAMFKCVENPSLELCKDRKNIPLKKSLKNIIKLVDTNPEAIGELSNFVKELIGAIGNHKEDIRTEVNKFRSNPLFVELRLKLIDAIALKVKNGLNEEDRTFITTILNVGNKNGDMPWIYQWLHDEKLGREKFRDLVEYPVLTNPDFLGELKALRNVYDGGLSCSIKKDSTSNDLIEFEFKSHLSEYVSIIRNKNYKSFYDYTTYHLTALKASTEICKELEVNKYNSNFLKTVSHLADFVSEKKYYDLMKFLLTYSTAKNDPDKGFSENLYLFDLLASDIFNQFNGVNGYIVGKTRTFYPLIFDVASGLSPESLGSLSNVVGEVTKKENDLKFVGVSDFWNFFTDEEKNYVFNFVDRHFDKGVDYVLLFDFYAKFLSDIQETQPIFKSAWMGSDQKVEESYLALEDIFSNMSGKDTLDDFKKFFSRNQILKVLEVLSNGQKIVNAAKAEMSYRNSSNYILLTKSEKYKYRVSYDPGSDDGYDAKPVLECLNKFSEIQNGFYELVRNLPAACQKVTKENLGFRLFGWLNTIDTDYLKYKPATDKKLSLFDDMGIMSPYMLNTNIALAKIIDNIFGKLGQPEPTTKGIDYLLDSMNYYLNQNNGIKILEKDLSLLGKYLNVNKDQNVIYRNSLIKSFSSDDNFSYSRQVFTNLSDLVLDYGSWVGSGAYTKAVGRSLGQYDSKFDCNKVINQHIADFPCPSKDEVKKYGSKILTILQNVWEKSEGSPIQLLIQSGKTGEGLDIPLGSSKTKKYRLTFRETFKYLYDTSDPALKINHQKLEYTNLNGDRFLEDVNVLERIETVIREVRFGNNYLGSAYLNYVVEGDNYSEDVKNRKGLFSKCIKIPGVRCGRSMSESDHRMAVNAVNAFDALGDANDGKNFNYGDYLKTFQQTLVGSSAKEAQKSQLLPLKDEVLVKHNGQLLSNLTLINGFSNCARVVRDRVGRTREEFDAFMKREDFKRVDRALLAGFDLKNSTISAQSLINKLNTVSAGETQSLFATSVDWVAGLNYDETRLVEDTVARLLVVGSFLGTPELVFEKKNNGDYTRYQNNNLYQMFLALEKIVDYWPNFKKYFPADVKLITVIKPINTFLYYLTDRLNSSNDPKINKTYIALNDLFYVLQTVIFDDVKDARILGNNYSTYKGLDFILAGSKSEALITETYNTIRETYNFSDIFYKNQGAFFQSFGQNVKRMTLNNRVDMSPIKEYLKYSSKNATCTTGDSKCESNYHYDEVANIIQYLNQKDEAGNTNLSIVNKKVLIENYSELIEMIDNLIPAIHIKAINNLPLIN